MPKLKGRTPKWGPFTIEQWKTGRYEAQTRSGRSVRCLRVLKNDALRYCVSGKLNGLLARWTRNGRYHAFGICDDDILIRICKPPKRKRIHAVIKSLIKSLVASDGLGNRTTYGFLLEDEIKKLLK